jgi:hypothetical protein
VAGGADNGSDFAFRVKLVVNNVETKSSNNDSNKNSKLLTFARTYNDSIEIYIFLFFIYCAHVYNRIFLKIKQICP